MKGVLAVQLVLHLSNRAFLNPPFGLLDKLEEAGVVFHRMLLPPTAPLPFSDGEFW